MSALTKAWNFLTWRDLPANRPIQTRAAATTFPPFLQGKPQWLPTDPASLIIEGYDRVVTAFACVNVLANAVASAPLRTYQNLATGDLEAIEATPSTSPGRLALLVDAPNPKASQPEFIESVVKISAVTGVCVYEKVRGPLNQVISLYPLRTDWLYPIPRNNQAFDWEYRVPGVRPPFFLPAEDVGVFQFNSSPQLGPMGTPPLMAAMRAVAIENSMADFVKLFFQNNGVPSWIAVLRPEYQNISQDDAEATSERMRQKFGDGRGAGQIGILPALEDLKRVSLDYNEMAFAELNKMTTSSICSAFGVPPILVQTQLGIEASTYSNYGQARRAFYEDTIVPLWRKLDGAMTRALLPEFDVPEDVTLEFDTSEIPALQDDLTNERAQKIQLWEKQVIRLNEIRSDFGYAEIDGEAGNAFYTPASPFGMLPPPEEEDAEDEALREAGAQFLRNWQTLIAEEHQPLIVGEGRPDALAHFRPAVMAHVDPTGERTNGYHPIRRLPPEQRARVATTAHAAYESLMHQGAPALRRFWRQQGERVIAASQRNLPANVETRTIADIDWDEEERLLQAVLDAIQQRATRRGWLAALEQGIPASAYEITNPYVNAVLGELATRVVGINQTTMLDVRRVVGDALDEGVTMDDLASRLKGLFTETYRNRSLAVARTESQVAYNLGKVSAGKASGVADYAELMDNPLHDTDPGSDGLTCAGRNGLIVPLDSIDRHVFAEHPNGTLAVALVVNDLED